MVWLFSPTAREGDDATLDRTEYKVLVENTRGKSFSIRSAELFRDRLLCVASRFQFYFFPRSFLC